MNRRKLKIWFYVTVAILGGAAVSGCARSKTVPADTTNWKGGPMPKDFDPSKPAPTPVG